MAPIPSIGDRVLSGEQFSAEAVSAQCLRHARIYERASRRQASAGVSLSALIFAWGSDISLIQMVLLERIVIGRREPVRRYFAAAESLVTAFSDPARLLREGQSAADLQLSIREELFEVLARDVALDIAGRLPDVTYLADLVAPTAEDFRASARERLQGLTAAEFTARYRREANHLLIGAQGASAAGEAERAIGLAYESDFRSLEAYLVDSAVTVGDVRLLTVDLRWELVVQAMSEVSGLPDAFEPAVERVRGAMAAGLGEPDGSRFLATLPEVSITH